MNVFIKQLERKYFYRIIKLNLMLIFKTFLLILLPLFLNMFISQIFDSIDIYIIVKTLLYILGVLAIVGTVEYYSRIYKTRIENSFMYDMYHHLILCSFESYEVNESKRLSNYFEECVGSIVSYSVSIKPYFIIDVIKFIVLTKLLANIDFILILLVVFQFVILKLVNLNYFKLFSEKNEKLINSSASFKGFFRELFNNLTILKIKGYSNKIYEIFISKLSERQKYNLSLSLLTTKISLFENIIVNVLNILIVCFFALKISNKTLAFGDYVSSSLLMTYLGSTCLSLTMYSRSKLIVRKSLEKLSHITIGACGDVQIDNVKTIELNGIYLKFDKVIFDFFSYTFEKGHIYLLKGDTGVGKTTLLFLVLGFYKNVYSGNIFINEIDINAINVKSFLDYNVSCSLGEFNNLSSSLFHSIYDNFDKLDNGYLKTFLFNDNLLDFENLSLGERKKIDLFICLNKETDIYLLDEPTNGLDEKSIESLNRCLLEKKEKSIIIITSHDKKMENITDHIIEL